MAQTVTLTNKYWNLLFEMAILLLPIGSLVAFWGFSLLGLAFQLFGILMLPALWITRWKFFGGDRNEMQKALLGWGLYIGYTILRMVAGDSIVVYLSATSMGIVGIFLIYCYGVHLERGKRFWLVIALYVGIPIYIAASSFGSLLSATGAMNKANPFGYDYRVVRVLYGDTEDLAVVDLDDMLYNRMYLDGERIGMFEYRKPDENQTVKGIWELVPAQEPEGLYKLEVDENDVVTLSYLEDDQLQWRWELEVLDPIYVNISHSDHESSSLMDWYYPGEEFDLAMYFGTNPGTVTIQCANEEITELILVEEFYHYGDMDRQEYVLTRDEKGIFTPSLDFDKRYDPGANYQLGDQYVVYYIEYNGGTYVCRIDLK